MGYRKPFDLSTVYNQINSAGLEMNSPYLDGYNQWMIKQDMYRIKWLVDAILKDGASFVGESEFLEEHQKDVMWRILKK